MESILTIDVGAGTTDILVYFPLNKEHYKAVAVSSLRQTTNAILGQKGDLLVTGTIMGGGSVSMALLERTKVGRVYMTTRAAQTVSHDLAKVRKQGILVVSAREARQIQKERKPQHLIFGDISIFSLRCLLRELGVGWGFTYVAAAVQDHGVSDEGTGSLDFRHQVFKKMIEADPSPENFLFGFEEIPPYFLRMQATGNLLLEVPHRRLYMMDTGVAAMVGASLDPAAKSCSRTITIDIGNSHTLAALLSGGKIGGFFEYHTGKLKPKRFRELVVNLGDGKLNHRDVIAEGGHGAYVRDCPGFNRVQRIVITGPRRREIAPHAKIDYIEGAPLGDNMMTGTAGLLECINRREKLGIW